jgi:hypothetical protein
LRFVVASWLFIVLGIANRAPLLKFFVLTIVIISCLSKRHFVSLLRILLLHNSLNAAASPERSDRGR